MRLTPVQQSYSSGEISPLLYGHAESPGYQSGCSAMFNMIPDARGPAISRRGTKYLGQIAGEEGRGIVFQKDDIDYYIILLTDLTITILDSLGVIAFTTTTPYLEAELKNIHFVFNPVGNTIYLAHPVYPVQKITYDRLTDVFTFTSVAFTNPPASWTGSNYPRTGTYFQGRLWLGGTPDAPQTLWASKSSLPEDFTLGALADDAMVRTISEQGSIRWIESTKNLLVGTDLGEHIVTSQGGVITPEDIQITQQSAYGSNHLQPKNIGDQVFYVSPNGLKVRSMQYDWTVENWQSQDVTFFSSHITESGIKSVAWIQNPNNIFMAVLESGNACALTYEGSQDVFGWSRTATQSGEYVDVSAESINGNHIAVYLVRRKSGFLHIETAIESDREYMDSWIVKEYGALTSIITGLDHLEGEEVQVVGDGSVQPSRVVVAGAITIKIPAMKAVVGKQIYPRLLTLPLDKGSDTGSAQQYLKRNAKIHISLFDSGIPLINGVRAPTRLPSTPMGIPTPLVSGLVDGSNLGWDRLAQIEISQDLPLPLVVRSILIETDQDIIL